MIDQHTASSRKQWQHLGKFVLPLTFSAEDFLGFVGVGMIKAFEEEQNFMQFESLIHSSVELHQPCHCLTSQHASLTSACRHIVQTLHSCSNEVEALDKWKAFKKDYTFSMSYRASRYFNCVKFTYDRRSRTVSASPLTPPSPRPQNYPRRLNTTSEILQYVSALFDASGSILVDIGDIFYVTDFAWIKFVSRFIESQSIELDRFQTNVRDPEEWDFINTELEYEIWSTPKSG